jgi:hypothetical protein
MKFKYQFQKVLPRARLFRSADSQAYKLKDVQSRETMHRLKAAGFEVEGEVNHENNTTFGMVKGDEHIVVTDSGKYPFHLGDTTIRPGYMTQFYDAPINLR